MEEIDPQIRKFVDDGRNLVNNGRAEKAVLLYKEAVKVAEKLREKRWQGYFWQQQGVALMTEGKYEEAISAIEQSLRVFDELKDFLSLGNVHRDLGIIKTKQEKYDEAINWFEISLDELLTHTNDWNAVGVTEAKLATAQMLSGDVKTARKTFESALSNVRKNGDWFMEMTTLLGFANLDYKENRIQEMINKLWACLGIIYEKGDYDIQKRRLVEIYGLLAKGYEVTAARKLAVKLREKEKGFLKQLSKEARQVLKDVID